MSKLSFSNVRVHSAAKRLDTWERHNRGGAKDFGITLAHSGFPERTGIPSNWDLSDQFQAAPRRFTDTVSHFAQHGDQVAAEVRRIISQELTSETSGNKIELLKQWEKDNTNDHNSLIMRFINCAYADIRFLGGSLADLYEHNPDLFLREINEFVNAGISQAMEVKKLLS
ncbi:MAG: hypothetical protein ABIH69_07755 [bacterium]|nr:hypothetical protein [Candidatus Margulisiibacteriota bacterium]